MNNKLQLWQERLAINKTAYEDKLEQMDERERIYRGTRELENKVPGDCTCEALHVRNLTAEIIEAQVSSTIPMPKVTPKRKQDERLAKIIEDKIRNELDRMPFEQINDQMERTVPIQGGGLFLLEWDNALRTHTTVGELVISMLHPKTVIPQDGVYSGIEDMDYIIIALPQTKEYIRRRYGVSLDDETEEMPEAKSIDRTNYAEDMVTQYVAYYRNDKGGIGKYSWACDTELEDLDDYQARRVKRCKVCNTAKPLEGDICPTCGANDWTSEMEDYENIYQPIERTDGSVIPGLVETQTEVVVDGIPVMAPVMVPTRVPYYKPDIYPVILQKNVSLYGEFLGDSDVDKIRDQQNTVNRIETKILEKLVKSGSYLILPDDASIRADAEDMKVIRPGNAANAQLINVKTLEGDISQDIAYMAQAYEEARQTIGVTDSFQGRRDTTATSGKAKEFSAAQAAGRLESKRVMKEAAYSALFEAMFKFMLAYTDEPRPVLTTDLQGNPSFEEFNRYDFLEQDETGEWYWNDQFLFSCDTSAPLANNREAMWQETRQNLQSGAFGDPTDFGTLIMFWSKMEQLHYPGAAETKQYLIDRQQQQIEQQEMMMQQQAAMQKAMMMGNPPGTPGVSIDNMQGRRTQQNG